MIKAVEGPVPRVKGLDSLHPGTGMHFIPSVDSPERSTSGREVAAGGREMESFVIASSRCCLGRSIPRTGWPGAAPGHRLADPKIDGFNAALLEFKKTAKGAQAALVY